MENLVEFWKNKKIVVTGHTGFKGAWLSLFLQYLGAKTIGVALDPTSPMAFFEQALVGEAMVDIRGDIGHPHLLLQVIQEHQPEIIFHLAAQSLVRPSYLAPQRTYMTNVMGTVQLFEAVRQTSSVKAVVNITSDKCYKNQEWHWSYRENDVLGGFDPYSTSKACAELVTASYRQAFFQNSLGVATARAGNVIGGGDWAEDRLVPDFIRSCIDGVPLTIRNPQSIRPWQHVLDPLFGYLQLAEKLYNDPARYGDAWNFGPSENSCLPVQTIVDKLVGSWGPSASYECISENRYHEATFLKLDSSKARVELNWHPRLTIENAIQMTIEWYRKCLAQREDMRQFALYQVQEYIDLFQKIRYTQEVSR
jgi:CDP-glucose 4,6-dehydratase